MFLPDNEANAALDALFASGPTRWLGLSTTEPSLRADGNGYDNVTEPSAASYGRVEVAPGDWSAAVDRFTEAQAVFPDPVEDLGVIEAWVLFDAATGGTARVAGVAADAIELLAGSSGVTVTCRVEAPL